MVPLPLRVRRVGVRRHLGPSSGVEDGADGSVHVVEHQMSRQSDYANASGL
jgi:hypothetical protein